MLISSSGQYSFPLSSVRPSTCLTFVPLLEYHIQALSQAMPGGKLVKRPVPHMHEAELEPRLISGLLSGLWWYGFTSLPSRQRTGLGDTLSNSDEYQRL